MGDDLHKDMVFNCTRDIIKQELKEAQKLAQITNKNLTTLPFLIKELGLDLSFNTLDEIFSVENSSKQPLIYTPNLKHVIELAKKEGRELSLMYGVCLFENSARIIASNGKHTLGLPPFHYKELDPDAPFCLDQLLKTSEIFLKRPFPGGKPDIGKLIEYNKLSSFVPFEPSLGKALKFFKYFEISKTLGSTLNLWIPVQEYLDEIMPTLDNTPFTKDFVENEIKLSGRKFKEFVYKLQQVFYPDVKVDCFESTDEKIRLNLEKICKNQEMIKAVDLLGNNSYGKMHWGETVGKGMDNWYSSMFLSSEGNLLIDKDSPSRILFVHARDLTSFALQSLWVYQQIADKSNLSWKDRVAVVGVSGAPAFRLFNDEERMNYIAVAYRLTEDDYLARGPTCLFVGDSPQTIKRKIDEMKPTEKHKDPMYSFIRQLHYFVNPTNQEITEYIKSYPSLAREKRFELGKTILYDLITSLKEKTDWNL